MFEIKYKKSLKFKYVSQGTGLDLIDVVENNHHKNTKWKNFFGSI